MLNKRRNKDEQDSPNVVPKEPTEMQKIQAMQLQALQYMRLNDPKARTAQLASVGGQLRSYFTDSMQQSVEEREARNAMTVTGNGAIQQAYNDYMEEQLYKATYQYTQADGGIQKQKVLENLKKVAQTYNFEIAPQDQFGDTFLDFENMGLSAKYELFTRNPDKYFEEQQALEQRQKKLQEVHSKEQAEFGSERKRRLAHVKPNMAAAAVRQSVYINNGSKISSETVTEQAKQTKIEDMKRARVNKQLQTQSKDINNPNISEQSVSHLGTALFD